MIALTDRMKKPSSVIIYRGPSMLDGAPILVTVIGLVTSSRNIKTGAVLQTYIQRSDVDPIAAVKSGADSSICGDCPRRSADGLVGRSCYVNVGQGPQAVHRASPRMPEVVDTLALRKLAADRVVRLGTYGDPAAVPLHIWQDLLGNAAAWIGYTHQWRKFPGLAAYCMASADSEEDAIEAQAAGWRTFRVRSAADKLLPLEKICPASAEAGKRLNCYSCRACGGGDRRGSIAIIAHGSTPAMRAA